MHVVINALTIHPGGGLTVIRGLVRSLRLAAPEWKLSVLTSNAQTHHEIQSLGGATCVERILPGASSPLLFLWQNSRLGAWLKRHEADVVITVNHYLSNISCPQVVYHLNLLRFSGPQKLPVSLHSFSEWLRDRSARRAVRQAAANVFESRYLQDAAESACGQAARNSSVIYIGLPDELMNLSGNEAASSQHSRRIVSITSTAPHKDNPTLIRTLAELVAAEPQSNWHLDIAGGSDPAEWESTKGLARELKVFERVTWHGFCDQQKLTTLLRGAHCLISTSLVESFAMVALEAMARGCPPIVADCAAMPESVGDAGLLAEPGNPRSFAEAILRIAEAPALRRELVTRGQKWIQRFRWSECGAAFVQLITREFPQNTPVFRQSRPRMVG